jgi:hypothetical protein
MRAYHLCSRVEPRTVLPALMLSLAACPSDDDSGGEVGGECIGTDTNQIWGGVWEGEEDWTDVGEPGNESIVACGWSGVQNAHHCFLTAIHAIHMHTGEILMFHGIKDQRVWKIGTDPEAMRWHPNLLQVELPTGSETVPDTFCVGHAQLPDGKVFLAGGNINNQPSGGGLQDTFIFDPVGAPAAIPGQEAACPFGWQGIAVGNGRYVSATPRMTHDRWYPTLTALRDGRILIAGGWSREAAGEGQMSGRSRLLEVYDPVGNNIQPLTGAEFPVPQFPIYPQMFLLPNGDVFYAGSEDATNAATSHGRFRSVRKSATAGSNHERFRASATWAPTSATLLTRRRCTTRAATSGRCWGHRCFPGCTIRRPC